MKNSNQSVAEALRDITNMDNGLDAERKLEIYRRSTKVLMAFAVAKMVSGEEAFAGEDWELAIDDMPLDVAVYRLRAKCNGRDSVMGYTCCLAPNHKGLCFSNTKHVDFQRET